MVSDSVAQVGPWGWLPGRAGWPMPGEWGLKPGSEAGRAQCIRQDLPVELVSLSLRPSPGGKSLR